MDLRFERVSPILGEGFDHLRQKKISVVGLGGVGGICAEALVRCGMTNLVLVDFDRYEWSNINRQNGASTQTIGQLKTEVLTQKLLDINPELNLEVHSVFLNQDNNHEILATSEAIIDAIDSMSAKMELIRYGTQTQKVFISSMGMANRLDPSQIEVSRIEKTYNDPFAKRVRIGCKQLGIKNLKVVFSKELPKKNAEVLTSFMPVTASAGLLLASELIKDLMEKM